MGWNIGNILEGVASVVGDDPALIHGDRVLTWAELDRRSNALARYLIAAGARPDDKLAIYSYNRVEWMETVVAAFKARLVPVNVNYRYRDEELAYLLENSDSVALVVEPEFLPNVERIRAGLPKLRTVLALSDEGPAPAGVDDYEAAVAGPCDPLALDRSPDDLLFVYTGGTTGMPKGVMWRQEDLWRTLGGGGDPLTGSDRPADLAEHLENVGAGKQRQRLLPACPLMHGTGLFTAINALMNGGAVVTVDSRHLDPHALWSAVERCGVNAMAIVGDVFAKPLADALEDRGYDLSSLRLMVSSGVMWSRETKLRLLDRHPGMILFDSLGSSEATGLGASVMMAGMEMQTASFQVGDKVKVFTEDGREVAPGSGERGLVARSGPIPVGYYKDPEKTAATFRVFGGVRYAVPGDWATVDADGTMRLLGRGSVCINTGGEKVFPEEVEEVLKRHSAVVDAAVVGLPDEKWGQAITALVTLAPGAQAGGEAGEAALRAHVRDHLAGYKVPKRVFVVDSLGRSPSGKMNYKGVTERAMQLSGS